MSDVIPRGKWCRCGFPHETGGPCWECRRADLPATDEQIAADPKVQALVNLLTRAVDDIEKGWLAIKGVEEKYNTDGSWHIAQDARAALAQFNQEKETHQ
jgi:hypothetical protein